ncbi:hypothetical protein LZ023_36480 (plasmid) [Pseudomonas silvicola]|nr:hypothetical protein LZ023_36480 [Pseudomonas silvicola]
MISYSNLGIYSVALTIGGAWSFIVLALITSFFSKIYNEKNQPAVDELLSKINRIVILLSLVVLGGFYLFGDDFIHLLYGNKYMESAEELYPYHYWHDVLVTGTICYRYMIKAGYNYLAKKMFFVY